MTFPIPRPKAPEAPSKPPRKTNHSTAPLGNLRTLNISGHKQKLLTQPPHAGNGQMSI